jgi:hypothetical protein
MFTVLFQSVANFLVAQHVVRRGWLLDPVKLELRQLFHPGDGLIDAPLLVGVHHQEAVGTNALSHYSENSLIGKSSSFLRTLPNEIFNFFHLNVEKGGGGVRGKIPLFES